MKLPLAAIWKKYKLVLLVAAVGVVLMLLPGGKQTRARRRRRTRAAPIRSKRRSGAWRHCSAGSAVRGS